MSVFEDDILKDEVAFVTGGGSGTCRGVTQTFMAHGVDTAIVGREEDRLRSASR